MFLKTWQVTVPHVDAEFFSAYWKRAVLNLGQREKHLTCWCFDNLPWTIQIEKKKKQSKRKKLYSFDLRGTRWNDKHLM